MVSGSDTVVGGMCVGAAMDLLILVCSVNALLDNHLGRWDSSLYELLLCTICSVLEGIVQLGEPHGIRVGWEIRFSFFHSSHHYINDKLPR